MSALVSARRSRWAGWAVMAVAATTLVFNVVWLSSHWTALRPISPGDAAPTFELLRIDSARSGEGQTMDLAALRGNVVLIDFWAEWCSPCRRAMPAIEAVYQRFRDKGFEVISVKTDGRSFGKRGNTILQNTSFPIVWDNQGIASRYKVTTIPHLVLVDATGVVRHVHRGYTGVGSLRDDLSEQIQALLTR